MQQNQVHEALKIWKVLKLTSNLFDSKQQKPAETTIPLPQKKRKETQQLPIFFTGRKGCFFHIKNNDFFSPSTFWISKPISSAPKACWWIDHFIMPSCVRSRPNTGSLASFKCTSLGSKILDQEWIFGRGFFSKLFFWGVGWVGSRMVGSRTG